MTSVVANQYDLEAIENQLIEVRDRLQALEQNTTSSPPASQKPCPSCGVAMGYHNLWCRRAAQNYWIVGKAVFATNKEADEFARSLIGYIAPVHVREVL